MTITHIFFGLYGTLIDSAELSPCYAAHLSQILAQRYGASPALWTKAYRDILADWDSYYADLDLDGDEGIQDMWEGLFRTTRALFRLVGVSEPDKPTLTTLTRELPYLASSQCDALYLDAKPVVRCLFEAGYILGVVSHITSHGARGLLTGALVIEFFRGQFLCPDVTERFQMDEQLFRGIHITAHNCLLVDSSLHTIQAAKDAGMRTIQLVRGERPSRSPADDLIQADLCGLLDYLNLPNL